MKNLTYILSIVLIASIGLKAQSTSGQSRLNVGENPKMPTVKSNLNSYIVAKVPNEVTLSKESALSAFYKELLITAKKKTTPKVVFNNKEMEDYLFSNENVVVSNIYPNPANDFAYINYNLKNSASKASITFHDLLGGQLEAQVLDSFDRKLTISTRNWENGIYFYQLVVDGKKVATKKLLVRHN